MVHFVEFGEFYFSTSQVLTNDLDRYCHRFLLRIGDDDIDNDNEDDNDNNKNIDKIIVIIVV